MFHIIFQHVLTKKYFLNYKKNGIDITWLTLRIPTVRTWQVRYHKKVVKNSFYIIPWQSTISWLTLVWPLKTYVSYQLGILRISVEIFFYQNPYIGFSGQKSFFSSWLVININVKAIEFPLIRFKYFMLYFMVILNDNFVWNKNSSHILNSDQNPENASILLLRHLLVHRWPL